MSEEPKILASISGGKDSLAALITHIESGGRCDGAVYCRIMFDDETSAEYPEHEDFLFNKCFPALEREYGVKTRVVQASCTYEECIYRRYKRGKNAGEMWGFPTLWCPWCNTKLKINPMHKFKKEMGKYTSIVGIAADEEKRIKRKIVSNEILPLVEHGITEAEAFGVCRSRGLLSPSYCKGRTRLGCWFCHNQRIIDLKRLYYNYPELWKKLERLEKDSPRKFTPRVKISEYQQRFDYEGLQITLFDNEEGGP